LKQKITAIPRQRNSKFSGFLDKIGLGTASSSTKSCMDVLVTETNDRSTTDICNINFTAVGEYATVIIISSYSQNYNWLLLVQVGIFP
jgi:hypothetical protein